VDMTPNPTPWIKGHTGNQIEIYSADGESVLHMRLSTDDPEMEAIADRIIATVNTHDAMKKALEAWEKWLLARAAGGRADTELMDAAIAQKRASNALEDAKKGGA
jgi:hypothetical protein